MGHRASPRQRGGLKSHLQANPLLCSVAGERQDPGRRRDAGEASLKPEGP